MAANILDTDLYKLTMQNAVIKKFPDAWVEYSFFNRGKHKFPEGFGKELRKVVDAFADIKVIKEDIDFLREKCYYFDPVYLGFLKGYQFDPSEVQIRQEGNELDVTIEGLWYRTILWEVPLMAAICELYYNMTSLNQNALDEGEVRENNRTKADAIKEIGVKVAEFGTRRRFSFANQRQFIIDAHEILAGTSNLFFARQYGLTPIGTQAHEWYSFHAAKFGFAMANQIGMKNWVDVYQGDLGIALPDTFTTKAFLRSFNTMYAKLFDGTRQDSGDSLEYTDMLVNHYQNLRIDPTTKSIVYSDGIDSVEKIQNIHNYAKGKVKDGYGIGTWFTNDVGVRPMNIVIKLVGMWEKGLGWTSAIKLSDHPTKHTGDEWMINLCKNTLNI